MRLALLLGLLLAGCGNTFTDATRGVIDENVTGWHRVRTYIALTGTDADVDGKDGAGWMKYSQAQLANAFILQAKSRGERLTFGEALAQAEGVELP